MSAAGLPEFLLAQPVRRGRVKTPATAATVPGHGPTVKESNVADRTAPECGCSTPGKIVRGMCVMHYDRWVHTTPKDQREPAPRFARSFWDHVDKTPSPVGCWTWTGPLNNKGYGR